MILVWFLVGVVASGVAFFLPGYGPDLWPNITWACATGAVYTLALIIYAMRPPVPIRARLIAYGAYLFTLFVVFRTWTAMYDVSHYRRHALNEIHSVICRDVSFSTVEQGLLAILDDYYRQGGRKDSTLLQIFLREYPPGATGAGLYEAMAKKFNVYPGPSATDFNTAYVASISDSEIAIVGEHSFSKGRDLTFKNYDNLTGVLQTRMTLTPKGVSLKDEN